MLGFNLGLSMMREQWHVVRGKDGLTHWLCIMVDMYAVGVESASAVESDETTYCGQTFFDRMSVPASTVPITCLECTVRTDD